MARERPKRTPPLADGWHVAWRKRVQGMLADIDRQLSVSCMEITARLLVAQRRDLVDLLDPGVYVQWVETYPLEIQIPCLEG